MPPLAVNSIPGNCLRRLPYRSNAGPCRVPSLEMSVQITFFSPSSRNIPTRSSTVSPESLIHPWVATLPSLTSAPSMILPDPYSYIQLRNSSGSVTAMLPQIAWAAPLSRTEESPALSFIPPPHSISIPVAETIFSSTSRFRGNDALAPSRSTI